MAAVSDSLTANGTERRPWNRVLYIQVLIAIVLGALVGWLFPDLAKSDWVKALGDGFVRLIRMVIAPIIFSTVVVGLAGIAAVRKAIGDLPLVAIGGITPANAPEVLAAGADSVAMISALWPSGSRHHHGR